MTRTDFRLTRRGAITTAFAAAALFSGPASALDTDQARALVDRLVNDINRVIGSGKSEAAMVQDFDALLSKYADMPIIAQTVLGPPWRGASAAERQAFTQSLQGYLARKYGKRFREFVGGEIQVQSARAVRGFFEVKSVANLRVSAPFELVFLISNGSGRDLFFNMIIEGVNLRTTENTEINALLDRNGGDIGKLSNALRSLG
jgi:phospholipid transport system substrate-binding protein